MIPCETKKAAQQLAKDLNRDTWGSYLVAVELARGGWAVIPEKELDLYATKGGVL